MNSNDENEEFEEFIKPLLNEIQNLHERFEISEKKQHIELKIIDRKTEFRELNLSKVSIHWTEEKICFYVYRHNLEKHISFLKQKSDDFNFNQLLVEIARHEYGHILTTDSIEDYDILKSEDSIFNLFLEVFEEFYACKKIREMISPEPPWEIITSNLITLGDAMNCQLEPIIENFFSMLKLTIENFVFEEFNEVLSKFKNSSDLFNLIYKVHERLNKIIDNISDDNLSDINLKSKLVILLEWIKKNL